MNNTPDDDNNPESDDDFVGVGAAVPTRLRIFPWWPEDLSVTLDSIGGGKVQFSKTGAPESFADTLDLTLNRAGLWTYIYVMGKMGPADDRGAYASDEWDDTEIVAYASPGGNGQKVTVPNVDVVVHKSSPDTYKIPSILADDPNAKLHFVTVKGMGDVVLEAKIQASTEDMRNKIRDNLTWTTTANVPLIVKDRLQVSFSADQARMVPIQIKIGNEVAREIVGWVVWAEPEGKVRVYDFVNFNKSVGYGIHGRVAMRWIIAPYYPRDPYKADATVYSIWDDRHDIPDLRGPNTTPVPGSGQVHAVSGTDLRKGADSKWDVSRQWTAVIENPDGLTRQEMAAFSKTSLTAAYFTGQPALRTIPVRYPSDPVIGNDDASTLYEDNNPYDDYSKDLSVTLSVTPQGEVLNVMTVQKRDNKFWGTLASLDAPQTGIVHDVGDPNDTFVQAWNFKEFVRIELGGTWYRISSDYENQWYFFYSARKYPGGILGWGEWRDNEGRPSSHSDGQYNLP
ncbi:MAG: hypothetical protein AB1696_19660 [Planctomycetota bacterium]